MTELTPSAKLAINEYLEVKERRLVLISASTVVTLVALIGGFLTYVVQDARSKAESAAHIQFQDYRGLTIDPLIAEIRTEFSTQRAEFQNLRSDMSASFGNFDRSRKEIDELIQRAERALEGLNKAGGSLVFAKEIIDLKAELIAVRMRQAATQQTDIKQPNGANGVQGNITLDQKFPGEKQ